LKPTLWQVREIKEIFSTSTKKFASKVGPRIATTIFTVSMSEDDVQSAKLDEMLRSSIKLQFIHSIHAQMQSP
jgi:hypothetical protein